MLEDADAKSVTTRVGICTTTGKRRRRPKIAALFIAQIESFATCIAYRVVVPWRKAEFVGILTPRVGHAAIGDDRSKVPIRQYVHPRCGRRLPLHGRDDILAPIRREATESVVKQQIVGGRQMWNSCGDVGALCPDRLEARQIQMWCAYFHEAAPIDLLIQCATLVADDGARYRLEEAAVFNRHVLRRSHKNATRSVDHMCFNAGRNQPHDLFLKQLSVTAAILVPDHQIHHQSLQAPVSVGLHQLAHQFDIGRVANF